MTDFPLKTSFWFPESIETTKILTLKKKVDVIVVGGGFAGLSAALHLKKKSPDLRVLLLESKHLGFGASGRNGGWLVPFPPLYWLADNLESSKINSDYKFALNFCQDSIRNLNQTLGHELQREDWKPTKHYLIARNTFEKGVIRWLKSRLDKMDFSTNYFETVGADPIVGYPSEAVLSWDTLAVQPYKVIQSMALECIRSGVEIYEKTGIHKIISSGDRIHLETQNGIELQASHVILATNAYSSLIQQDVKLPAASIQHTYMLATEKLESEVIKKISRDVVAFGDPSLFYYCGRFYDQRLIFNGCDRASSASEADDQRLASYQKLDRELRRRFPFLANVKIESAWGGAVLQTSSDAPVIAAAKENPNLIFNIGFGGSSGICWALQSGRLTTDIILGKNSTDNDAQRLRKILEGNSFPPLGPFRAISGVLKNMTFYKS